MNIINGNRIGQFIGLAMGLLAFLPSQASAINLSIKGGGSNLSGSATPGASNPSMYLGGELTYGFASTLSGGFFFDHNFLGYADGTAGGLNYFGLVIRVGLGPISNLFIDGQAGLTNRTQVLGTSDLNLGFGAGLGYRISLGPLADISPRIGFRSLPMNFSTLGIAQSQILIDGMLMLTVGF